MKKTRLTYIFLTLAACSMLGTGCKKLLDINNDPNNLSESEATMEALFPSATISAVATTNGDFAIIGGMWAQYWAQAVSSSQYKDLDSYNISATNTSINYPYSQLYTNALLDYNAVIQKAKDKQDWRYYLMATVMKAYTYQVLVDLYDKVPYTEALQADKYLQPKFDDGYSVYKSLIAELDDALAKDFAGAEEFKTSQKRTDLLFGGEGSADFAEEMSNWEAFANTLKLKMYLRMVNVKAAEAEAGVKALINADNDFLNRGAGITIFKDKPSGGNPFYEANVRRLNTSSNLRASSTLGRWLKLNNDPRVVKYYDTEDPALMNQGDFQNTDPLVVAATTILQKPTDPAWFISKAESYFLQAEADERYFGGTNAAQLYRSGIIASFDEYAIEGSEAKADALLAGPYAYPAGKPFEEKLEAIITQKWAALYGSHAIEGFLEKNRTGYPRTSAIYSSDPAYVPGRFVYVPNSVIGDKLPQRFPFPDDERSRNANTPAEEAITTKVWWGK